MRGLLGLVGALGVSLLLTCGRAHTRHVYHVSDAQLRAMAQIAGIPPCPHGPTIVAGLTRQQGGGVLYIDCPLGGR